MSRVVNCIFLAGVRTSSWNTTTQVRAILACARNGERNISSLLGFGGALFGRNDNYRAASRGCGVFHGRQRLQLHCRDGSLLRKRILRQLPLGLRPNELRGVPYGVPERTRRFERFSRLRIAELAPPVLYRPRVRARVHDQRRVCRILAVLFS